MRSGGRSEIEMEGVSEVIDKVEAWDTSPTWTEVYVSENKQDCYRKAETIGQASR